ncbi:hypothetical protein PM030_05375 [Halorubrum ezzemoulense]|uniref:hypothetical protein n=1 Tax=Halorubrum ezzemoulense TaxID=337243 RepID=UPI0023302A56|nr:hypothetical protein [Halorubrum ezzemoulense]MDB2281300.1 hypothetical protein [Halorubrum ezzemoulense]
MTDYLRVSGRDVGAGLAGGGSALLASVLINLWNFFETQRGRGFDSATIAEHLRGSPIVVPSMILAPVIAVFVGTVVWRVMMPDEPNPRYGTVAGVVSALGSLFVFAASMGLLMTLNRVSAGTLVGALDEFLILTYLIAVFGGIITAPIIVPVGALVGYGYEWYIKKDQQ